MSDKELPAVARMRRRERNTIRYRLRKQTRPYLILGGLWGGATAAHYATAPAGSDGATLAVMAIAAGAAGWLIVERRRRRLTRRYTTGIAAAAAWCSWVVTAGPSWNATAVLLLVGYAAALRWWRRWRIPYPPEDPEAPPEPDEMSVPRLWERHVGCQGGPLPGSWLTNETRTKSGERYDLHLVPGKQSLGDTLTLLPKLRTGLLVRPRQDLILERHPELDESVLSMTVVRQSDVLERTVPWPGNTYDLERGTIQLGPYVDGDGIAEWVVRTPNRLHGGFVAGTTGSGKSRLLEALALGYAQAGCAVWFADPQTGASAPWLVDHADHAALDIEPLHRLLLAVQRVKRLRQMQNMINRWEGWEPVQIQANGESLHRPGLVIIIDECHVATSVQPVQELILEIAREGEKVGITVLMGDQEPTLGAFGKKDGADTLRQMVCSRNIALLRSMTRNTNMLPGVRIDATVFPTIPGYGYLIDHSGQRRSAPYRGYYLTDEARDAAASTVVWPELDPAAAAAAGDEYLQRRERAEAELAALAEYAAALAEGRSAHLQVPLQPAPAVVTTAPVRAGDTSATVPQVVTFPRWSDYHQPAPAAGLRRTAVDVIADLVAQGVASPGELQTRSGYSETQVRNALRELVDAGRVRRIRHGEYELT